ncbi:hypothetical protein FHS01_005538 [Longimicrobium terrae]|uniref:Uncharacterized protein n=1 Tax=Longimicrobium terrae TaxID=1639882 RepID=A0A841H6D1_9BACT|nr:hypothetical protein [Longimicrobium terrae]MBB6073835.1 hypothetical protein [Longimicrobium terrae]
MEVIAPGKTAIHRNVAEYKRSRRCISDKNGGGGDD